MVVDVGASCDIGVIPGTNVNIELVLVLLLELVQLFASVWSFVFGLMVVSVLEQGEFQPLIPFQAAHTL